MEVSREEERGQVRWWGQQAGRGQYVCRGGGSNQEGLVGRLVC